MGADLRITGASILADKDLKILGQNDLTILNLFRYLKNYQGKLTRNIKTIQNYRFSDEREWRYVPSSRDIDLVVTLDEYNTVSQKETVNEQLLHLRLEFTPDDITYIIINEESEINDFINVLRSAKSKTYTHQQVERLMTRILTTEQIMTDI